MNATGTRTCMILAGGFGTRVRSILGDVPKPMAPVLGRPFLEFLIAQARAGGCRHIVLLTGFQAQTIVNHFGDGSKFGVEIQYSHEDQPLGTGGAIAKAAALAKSDSFAVMNGDSYCPVQLQTMFEAHAAYRAVATISVAKVSDSSRFGTVEYDAQHRVQAFIEKGQSTHQGGYVSVGIYVLTHQALAGIATDKFCSIEKEIFPSLITRGLFALPVEKTFIDIGTPETLAASDQTLRELLNQFGPL